MFCLCALQSAAQTCMPYVFKSILHSWHLPQIYAIQHGVQTGSHMINVHMVENGNLNEGRVYPPCVLRRVSGGAQPLAQECAGVQ